MPNIHIARPEWSDDRRHVALERELRQGIALKQAMEHEREIVAAHEASMERGAKTVAGLGKNVFNMPQWEFHNLCNKYGHDEVHSKEFLQHAQKTFPHLAVAKI
jgi:hypothetical protein